jgi:ubiquinone/menaquinone biosynthesis C-methylase UbiE
MFKLQKNKEHYFKSKYNKLDRFISYFYQVDLITQFAKKSFDSLRQNSGQVAQDKRGKKILEIGKGNGFVSDYLKKSGFDILTFDFDKNLNPDIVGDVREINLQENSFDIVTAFEVLEHIPFKDVESVLEKINKITKKYAIISLPYRSTGFEFALKFPGIRSVLNREFISFFIRIPLWFKGIESSGQHYWEIDATNHPLGGIKRLFKRHFRLIKVIRPVLDNYRIFLVLEKK